MIDTRILDSKSNGRFRIDLINGSILPSPSFDMYWILQTWYADVDVLHLIPSENVSYRNSSLSRADAPLNSWYERAFEYWQITTQHFLRNTSFILNMSVHDSTKKNRTLLKIGKKRKWLLPTSSTHSSGYVFRLLLFILDSFQGNTTYFLLLPNNYFWKLHPFVVSLVYVTRFLWQFHCNKAQVLRY